MKDPRTRFQLGRLAAAAVGLLAGLPLLQEGLLNTRSGGDSPFLLVRVHQLASALEAGVFPVRWMVDAAYGLGYPFFHYYAAFPYYLAAILRLWGMSYVAAIETVQWMGLAGAGLAMYLLLRRLQASRPAALLGATVYGYAPFHLVNLYVRGDSLSEFFAFVWFPLILWSIDRLGRNQGPREVLAVGLCYAGLLLTHNISALIFTPFALAFGAVVWRGAEGARRRLGALLLAGLALGLGLAAWFWFPALLERHLVQLEEATTGYFHYAGHFRGSDLVQRAILFDYRVDARGTPFAMGSVQAVLAVASATVLGAAWLRRRRLSTREAYWLLSFLAATLLITPLSRPVWDTAPLLPFVQFPWRLLSVQALAAAALAGLALDRLPRYRVPMGLIAGAVAVAAVMGDLRTDQILVSDADVTAERLLIYEHFTGNIGSTVRAEYLPRWAAPRPYGSSLLATGEAHPAPIEGELAGSALLEATPFGQEWSVEVASERSRLAFPVLFFPGWEAIVDGRRVPVGWVEGSGRLAAEVSQGVHTVSLRIGTTPLRGVAEAASLAASAVASILLVWRADLSPRRLWISIAVVAAAVIGGALLQAGREMPPPTTADLTMDFSRAPFLHHTPEGVGYEESARLTGCTVSAGIVQAGEELTVECVWTSADDGLEAELRLASPAEHLFSARDAADSRRVPIRQGRSLHRLMPPSTVAPGLYYPAIRVYDGERELSASMQGMPMGTVHLHPVRVVNPRPATGDEPILARFGDALALSELSAAWPEPSEIQVDLTWWVLRPAGANYSLSLRLEDLSGAVVAQRDMQPRYGLYPTSDWPAGHLMADGYALPVPLGTPIDRQYRVRVILYRGWEAGLPAIGFAEVGGITARAQ